VERIRLKELHQFVQILATWFIKSIRLPDWMLF